jgi:MinD-like ATPase involved in chromosome partitioning or flagellar assembly
VATCLGLALAEHRGDRVVVLDANPDAGTLADRLTGESTVTVRELLRDLDRIHSWADITRYTSLAGRLQVLASEQDPAAGDAFNREEYERISHALSRFFNIVITDSGTGLVHSAMEGTLTLADSVIIVGAPTVDGASRASKTLDWLLAHGHPELADTALVVLSCDRTSDEVDAGRIREHFAARSRAVVEIPHDPHLATGGRVDLAGCGRAPATRSWSWPRWWPTGSTGTCPSPPFPHRCGRPPPPGRDRPTLGGVSERQRANHQHSASGERRPSASEAVR